MEYGGSYGFQNLSKFKLQNFEKKDMQEYLKKWSMIDGLKLQAYSFSKPFKSYLLEEFVQDFFACPAVTSTLERMSSDRLFGPIGFPSDKIQFSEIKCTATTMSLFDKLLADEQVVRKRGSIVKCSTEYFKPEPTGCGGDAENLMEIEVCDNLRKLILLKELNSEDEEELQEVFNKDDREEFILKLFGHLVIGGVLCQYEDYIQAYINCTKGLYKDLISVTKSNKDELQVTSCVCKIHCISNDLQCGDGKGNLLFHKSQFNNFLYLIIHPTKQICYTFYHHL